MAEKQEQKSGESGSRLALILSGFYLMDWKVGYVREISDEERERYAEWCRDRMVYLARHPEPEQIEERNSPTARRLAYSRETQREEKKLPGESRVILISEEDRDAILAECREAEDRRRAEERRREEKAEEKERAIYEAARSTGDPQILDSRMSECDDPREECSYDHVTVYAMPDGTTQTERQHTW